MTQSNYTRKFAAAAKALAAAALAVCGVAGAVKAQDLVKGTFTLAAETRFGSALLPAGHYTVSIAPITAMTPSGTRVVVFVRADDKTVPVSSFLAMASQESCDTRSGLTLLSESNGLVARSLCLSKQGMEIDFGLARSAEPSKIKASVASTQQ